MSLHKQLMRIAKQMRAHCKNVSTAAEGSKRKRERGAVISNRVAAREWGALFLRRSGMRANQSAAVVYIASPLFWRLSGRAGVCGILSGIDVLCACGGGGR